MAMLPSGSHHSVRGSVKDTAAPVQSSIVMHRCRVKNGSVLTAWNSQMPTPCFSVVRISGTPIFAFHEVQILPRATEISPTTR